MVQRYLTIVTYFPNTKALCLCIRIRLILRKIGSRYQKYNDKKLLVIMVILTVTLLIDTSLVKINDLIDKYFIPFQSKLILFSINSFVCLVLQLLLITFVVNSLVTPRLSKTPKIRTFYVISLISFILLAIFVGLLVFQQFYYQYYEIWINILIVTISYGTSTILIMWLALLFFSWYKSSHDFIVMLYSISMALIAFNLILTAIFIDAKLSENQYRVREFVGGSGDTAAGKHLVLEISKESLLSFLILAFG